jgi:hypothetical protein
VKNLIISLFILSLISGCNGGDDKMNKVVPHPDFQLTGAEAQKLSTKKIFFGHQSVGDNIIDGINKIMASNKTLRLNIEKTTDAARFDRPVFAHEAVGRNDDPESKIRDFHDFMDKGIGSKADIAFVKFCFWDIRSKTDAQQVFARYKAMLAGLKAKYPKVIFVHFTVPLMTHNTGLKAKIKSILQMDDETDIDNIRRNELNDLLLGEYSGKEPVFDIAKAESTLPDGRRTAVTIKEKEYYYLAQEYTNDGGHLNDPGKKAIAEQLLKFLAAL